MCDLTFYGSIIYSVVQLSESVIQIHIFFFSFFFPLYIMTSYGVQLPVLLEKEMATHSSALAWKIPWTEEPRRLQSVGSQRARRDGASSLSFFHFPCAIEQVLVVYYVCLLLFSRSAVSDSLRPHRLQLARPPCPSPTPRACSNPCPSSQ